MLLLIVCLKHWTPCKRIVFCSDIKKGVAYIMKLHLYYNVLFLFTACNFPALRHSYSVCSFDDVLLRFLHGS